MSISLVVSLAIVCKSDFQPLYLEDSQLENKKDALVRASSDKWIFESQKHTC